jgi:hypothetical protein
MKQLKFALVALSIILFTSCKEDSGSPTDSKSLGVEVGQYSPAQVGSYWKYELNQNGVSKDMTMTAVGTKEKVGKKWIEFESVMSGQTQIGYQRYENGKYYSLIPDGTTTIIGDFEFLLIDENAEKGDKWEIPADVRVQGTNTTLKSLYKVEVYDKYSSYEVRGNTYNNVIAMYLNLSATYYGQQMNLIDQIYYYASGVGVIKSVGAGSGTTISQELIEYKE